MKRASFVLTVLAGGLLVEALLAFRLWVQITGKPIESNSSLSLFSLTDDLIAPFQLLTGNAPLKGAGVIDFTLLVAMEGYFVAMLALLGLAFVLWRTGGWLAEHQRWELPYFVVAERKASIHRQVWQSSPTSRFADLRFYTPVRKQPRSAANEPAQAEDVTWT
jgi:hypothetical protein